MAKGLTRKQLASAIGGEGTHIMERMETGHHSLLRFFRPLWEVLGPGMAEALREEVAVRNARTLQRAEATNLARSAIAEALIAEEGLPTG